MNLNTSKKLHHICEKWSLQELESEDSRSSHSLVGKSKRRTKAGNRNLQRNFEVVSPESAQWRHSLKWWLRSVERTGIYSICFGDNDSSGSWFVLTPKYILTWSLELNVSIYVTAWLVVCQFASFVLRTSSGTRRLLYYLPVIIRFLRFDFQVKWQLSHNKSIVKGFYENSRW